MSILRFQKLIALSILTVSSLSWAGAVSGGGGGTLPADPVDPILIRQELADARNVVTAYLRSQEMDRALYPATVPTRDHNFDKLFAPGTDVFKFLGEVQIFTRDTPCHDPDGKETDASANVDVQGGICFSVARVHDKVGFTTYTAEIPALLLHEISHFYGTTEEEAVNIQRLAVRFFASMNSAKVFEWNSSVMDDVKDLKTVTSITRQTLVNGGKVSCNDLDDLSIMFSEKLQRLVDGGSLMTLTSEHDTEYFWQVETRVMAAADFLCGLAGFTDSYFPEQRRQAYEAAFGGKTDVTAREYIQSRLNDHDSFDRFPLVQVNIKKCATVADAASALNETITDLNLLYNILQGQWQAKFIVN